MSQQQLRAAVLLSFCDPLPPQCSALLHLSRRQWHSLQPWLDISGLALYLYDRFAQLNLLEWLPEDLEAQLRQNLADNTERTHSMLAESIEVQERFQRDGIGYLLLKGFSLPVSSVPRPELRSQLDLDFLVASDGIEAARRILEGRGYVLRAVSGRSWEFKTRSPHTGSLRDLYKNHPARSIELHVEASHDEPGTHVADAVWRNVCGFEMPVLAPVPLFLGQVAHLYKHVSTGFFRCSHLLELYRHSIARRDERMFWANLHEAVARNGQLALPLGVTTLLLARVMGETAPEELSEYVDKLSAPVRLWAERIGPRCVYATWPGTKLHLLLQRELAAGDATKKALLQRALLPRRLPPPIAQAPADETFFACLRRILRQLSYIVFRLRYHMVSAAHYAWELMRWKRLKASCRGSESVNGSRVDVVTAANDISKTNKGMTIR